MAEPNWDQLAKIARRARRLRASGRLGYDTFALLMEEAEAATNGHPEYTEVLMPFCKAGWRERLMAEEEKRKRVA